MDNFFVHLFLKSTSLSSDLLEDVALKDTGACSAATGECPLLLLLLVLTFVEEAENLRDAFSCSKTVILLRASCNSF